MNHFTRCRIGACLGLVTALLAAGCGKSPESVVKPTTDWRLPLVTVSAGAPLEYTSTGTVVSDQRIEVASRLSGYVRELLVREGDHVRQGQVLARIDAADVDSGIAQAQAQAASADAAYRDAKIDLDHFLSLYDKGNISESEMRKARLRTDAAKETLNQARAAVDAANAQRNYSVILSPIDGSVVARLRQAGDLTVPGGVILTLESGSDLVFETFVTEQQILLIKPGSPVTVYIDVIGTPINGKVRRVIQSADPVTRSYPVKISLPDTSGLLPGMFGRAGFMLGNSTVPMIPSQALIERGGLRGVFVVDTGGVTAFRWIRLGREWPDRVEVTAGLDVGERVVGVSEPDLREGDRVVETAGHLP